MIKKLFILLISFYISSYNFCNAVIDNRTDCLRACEVFDGNMQLCCFNCCYNNYEIGKAIEEKEKFETKSN